MRLRQWLSVPDVLRIITPPLVAFLLLGGLAKKGSNVFHTQSAYAKNDIYLADYIPPGDPKGCVFMFHGFPGSVKNYDIAEELARKGYRVIAPHYRGLGQSRGYGTFSFEQSINEMEQLVREFKADNPRCRITFLGHSWGGLVSISLSDLADELILMAPLSFIPTNDSDIPTSNPTEKPYSSLDKFTVFLHEMSYEFTGTSVEDLRSELKRISQNLEHKAEQYGLSEKSMKIFHGTEDSVIRYSQSVKLSKKTKNATLKKIEGAEHLLLQNRQKFIDAISNEFR